LPEASASPILYLFPNVLAICDAPAMVVGLLVAGIGLSVFFAVGFHDRIAALLLWYLWACLFGRNPLISNPGLPFVGWMLLAHVFLPPAPYGSWAARARTDAGGGWKMPQPIFIVAWIILALGYTYSGYTKLISPSWLDGTALPRVLDNPLARPGVVREAVLALPSWMLKVGTWAGLALELSFAPLALFRRVRPWIWGLLLLMHLGLIVFIDFADLSLGMVMVHFFTLDPAWIRPKAAPTERIFYDGHCGLCHRFIRFVLAEDRTGVAFRFAPLGSDVFLASVPEAQRANLPDSVVVQKVNGDLLMRSSAALYVLERMGGLWRVLGILGRVVPVRLRDWVYDGIAAIRYRLFATPAEMCPVMPKEYRARFDF
jgi:predicted DCC family thiol-disulfide oxidoreductase YuxK